MHLNHQTLFVLICKVDEGKFDFILCKDEFFVVGFTNVVFRFKTGWSCVIFFVRLRKVVLCNVLRLVIF